MARHDMMSDTGFCPCSLVHVRNVAEQEAAEAQAAADDFERALGQLRECSLEADALVRQLVGAIVPDELNSPCPPGRLLSVYHHVHHGGDYAA